MGGQIMENGNNGAANSGYSARNPDSPKVKSTSASSISTTAGAKKTPEVATLKKIHVLPVDVDNTEAIQERAFKILRKCKSATQPLRKGMVLSYEPKDEAPVQYVVAGTQPSEGALHETTQVFASGLPAKKLEKVQLDCIDKEYGEETEESMYRKYVGPKLQKLSEDAKELIYFVSRGELFTTDIKNDIHAEGPRFIVAAVEPDCPAGLICSETDIHISHDDTPVFEKLHICPYEDSLPSAYNYDLFEDYIRPFFAEHPGDVFRQNDTHTYNGVRFRIMATEPARLPGRLGQETLIFSEGRLQPTLRDLLPPELQAELAHMPLGLQILLGYSEILDQDVIAVQRSELEEQLRARHGLAESALVSIPEVEWNEDFVQKQCMVCLCDFEVGEKVKILPCQHVFHGESCIDPWLRRSHECPLCKQRVKMTIDTCSIIPSGADVICCGLQAANHNGLCGTVEKFDGQANRYIVKLSGNDDIVSVKSENLTQPINVKLLPGSDEVLDSSAPSIGIIKGYKPDDRSYIIKTDDGEEFDLEHSQILWPNSVIVEVVGLTQDTTWNNRRGTVLFYDHEAGRYSVQMAQDDIIRVLPKNIRA